jgi:cobalt/nickel transport system permease protein
MELDRHGAETSPVHGLDALAKLLATAVFVLAVVSFPKYAVAPLAPFFLYPLALGVLGGVPARPVLRLLLAGLPFVGVAAVVNIFLDRAPVGDLGVAGGWLSCASILLKYALTAGAVLVLVATTSFGRVLQALARLRTPPSFLMLLQLLYRYLFVLVEEAHTVVRARTLRDPRRRLPELRTATHMLSALFVRTWERAERVHRCMRLRGYDGLLPVAASRPWRFADSAFLCGVAAACAASRLCPVTEWLGRALAG